MLDKQNATANISLGEGGASVEYHPASPLESIHKDIAFAFTAEFITCVRFIHPITPSLSHPKLQPLFFVGWLKLYLANFPPGIAFLAWPTSL